MMNKKMISLLLALLMPVTAMAGTASGYTEADVTTMIMTDDVMKVAHVDVTVGQHVEAGDTLVTAACTNVYSSARGKVARISTSDLTGETVTTVTITPENKYTIYCNAEEEATGSRRYLHVGETLYIFCEEDGSHQAIGRVYQVQGMTYRVEVFAGELSVGEAVKLYRSETEQITKRVGVGTVLQASDIVIRATGTVERRAVETGDQVWPGTLLLKTRGKNAVLAAPVAGIVTEINASAGSSLQKGDAVVGIVCPEDIIISMAVLAEDAEDLHIGDQVTYTLACDDDGIERVAVVETRSSISTSEYITITLRPEEPLQMLGLSATIDW